ncbi:AraC-like DNA-binding protein [Rhodococcus sp. 27YEA15]|uniref:AraC-like ligand-binding domain-containing protein n=1 Tax=Rhodococcus sp. 27YEA15 TaxID=3156259 RepID=UPI003C7E949E
MTTADTCPANSPQGSSGTEKFGRWREAVSAAFVPLDAIPNGTDNSRFSGGLKSGALGSLHLSEVSGRAVDVRRTPATIRRADPGMIKVGLQLRGHGIVSQRDREAVLAPGDFTVYDTSEPYTLHFEGDFSMFVLMFSRSALKLSPADLTAVSARRVVGTTGMGSLVSPFLLELSVGLSGNTLPSTPILEDAVLDLVSAALDEHAPHRASSPGAVIVASAKSYIDAHLADPNLNTSSIAAAQHISTRYLQKLFEDDHTSVAGWIRSRRLDRCRRDLQDRRMSGESIGAICARHGLLDSSHFSRLFKHAYGLSPRAFRELHSE